MGRKSIPLVASSLDGGKTWIYPNSISANLPSNTANGRLFATSCKRADCIAEGRYETKNPGKTQYPLIATSHDAGQTWTYPSTVTSNLPSDYHENGIFTG